MLQKQGFLNLLKNSVINFHWIYSIMKTYIVCWVPAEIPYLGKILFLRCGPECSQTIRLQDFLINHIYRTNQWNSLRFGMLIQIHIWTKSWSKGFWMVMVKNGHGQSGHRTLKLTVSQEWIDEITNFLHDGANSGKLKLISMILGGLGQKWAWLFSSWDPKIYCIVRVSLWIELGVFCMLTVMQ